MMNKVVIVDAKDVQAGDEIKTGDGFLEVGGVIELSGGERVGLMTASGMLGVGASDKVKVRRKACLRLVDTTVVS
jgi:hypothetical protein